MQKIIFRRFCQILIFSIMGTLCLTMLVYYQYFFQYIQTELRHEAHYLLHNVSENPADLLTNLKTIPPETRLTLIDPNGQVLFDNTVAASELENHAARPEIQTALLKGEGEALRLSQTLDTQTFYYAKRLSDGSVIRLARTTSSIVQLISNVIPPLAFMTAILTMSALLFTRHIVHRLIAPINALDLEKPLTNPAIYDELSPLLQRLNKQQQEITEQFHKIEAQQTEFASIIENLPEGLIIINCKMQILSINNSASKIFSSSPLDCCGCKLLDLDHSTALEKTAVAALTGSRQDITLTLQNRTYQIIASPVYKTRQLEGAFLLFIDITEKHFAEKMRREFSANVSHELKTPLTSISGFAELLKNGLVKPPDIPGFAARIHGEATRMLTLINDIIKLSKLDEKDPSFIKEPLQLNQLIKETLHRLLPLAKTKQITFTFNEQPLPQLIGVRSLIDELIYNLLENAIKYNKPAGNVVVTTKAASGKILLTIADTGIGIPPQHHTRIFERFYRVDKSRSRQIGGTGLGLSIVKHIADYHKAEIALQSTENVGTVITVTFHIPEPASLL